MAWVTKSERFNWNKEEDLAAAVRAPSPSPGQYVLPTSFKEESKSRPCYAPFNSSCGEVQGGISGKKDDDALGLDPARYSPKQPGVYDHGLPRKHVPFTSGATRWNDLKQDFRPGPGDYAALSASTFAGAVSVASNKTMGVPPGEQRMIFKSTSAPSMPRDHQCYGYDEAGDGRLIRQGRKDGVQQLSGITSSLLARRNQGRVLAVDRSAQAVEKAKRRFPSLHLAVLDVASLRWKEYLGSELNALGSSWRHVACCFVDLGGDARLSDVLRALGSLGAVEEAEEGQPTPDLVVKSEALLRLYRNSQIGGKPGDSAGPGQYDAHKYRTLANSATGSKISPLPAEPVVKVSETPGPGHYVAKGIANVENPPKIYSAFASQSRRGRTKHEDKYAAEMPGPGQYVPRINRRPNMRELHPELQYFCSTAERFKEDEAAVVASKLPGPGAYGLADVKRQGKSFAWLKGKRFQEPSKKEETQPGPGAYYDQKSGWRNSSASILGGSGSLAFGSMEARRGISDPKKGQEPGPGAYYDGVEEASSVSGANTGGRKPRRMFPPSSFFRSTVPKDIMVAQYQKDGQVGPPPGAYSPRLQRDLGSVQRLAPKGEGFGSGSQRQPEAAPVGPGPGWYKVKDVTGGKIAGTFNRHAVDAAPASGKPRGLGFESQSKRFGPGGQKGEVLPGPGTYNTRKDSDWITLTHNIYFGDFA